LLCVGWSVALVLAAPSHPSSRTRADPALPHHPSIHPSIHPHPHTHPPSHETGEFFAIDIGGTNFRVLYVRLAPSVGGVEVVDLRDASIPPECFTCHADGLFDKLATTLLAFGRERGYLPATGPVAPVVGFCFSFPCDQTALDAGTLLKLTKRFENEGAVGQDPVRMLSAAFARAGAPGARVVALLNDSVGTLAGGRYADQAVELGVILGTGTNASYVENAAAVTKLSPQAAASLRTGRVVINTEWGNFASPHLPTLPADVALDAATPHAGEQLMEKQMSGMYLGEAGRRLLEELVDKAGLFASQPAPVLEALRTPGTLTTAALSAIEGDGSLTLATTAATLNKAFGAARTTWLERRTVRRVCHLVSLRSARLLAVAISSLLIQAGRVGGGRAPLDTAVAVDGGVYEKWGAYRRYVQDGLADALGSKAAAAHVRMKRVRDASSMGAAYLAAAAAAHAAGGAAVEGGAVGGGAGGVPTPALALA
jgi:hexokinase